MGWSKGKGLGANLDGEQSFIRVSHKIDQKGMGYQDRDDQWTSHENDFNSLLKSLDNSAAASANEESNDSNTDEMVCRGFGFDDNSKKDKKKSKKSIKTTLSGKSLEEMSKKSSARVHYKKFTRGKDISRYSEKDLANIFGKKAEMSDDDQPPVKDEINVKDEEPISNYGITTIETGTTIFDYFNKKKEKPSKRKKNKTVDRNSNIETSSDEPNKKRRKTGDQTETVVIEIADSPSSSTDKKKKKKKNKDKAENNANDENVIVNLDDYDDNAVDNPSEKKKKKKKNKREKSGESCEIIDVDLENSVEIVESYEKPAKMKKRKRQRSTSDATHIENENTTTEVKSNKTSDKSFGTQFIQDILLTIVNSGNSSIVTSSKCSNEDGDDDGIESTKTSEISQTTTTSSNSNSLDKQMALQTYEINRYQAEMFRFVDLDGFKNANLRSISGYGFGDNIDLKVTAKVRDESKISDLWDHALINKYGKEAVRAKKNKRYSLKVLKKKNLFKAL